MNKTDFRKWAQSKRAGIVDRAGKSRAIWKALVERFLRPDLGCVCSYIDIDPEVATQVYLREYLLDDSASPAGVARRFAAVQLAIPYCLPQQLRLFQLQNWAELTTSKWGLQEPGLELRREDRLVEPQQVDVFLVPGLAFDRRGNRLGYGKGYYDKLLGQRRPGSLAVALAFHEQVMEQVPFDPAFDIPMDYIVTEGEIIHCQR